MILIISDHADLQVYWVTYYLRGLSAPYVQFNVADYPLAVTHTSKWSEGNHSEYVKLPAGEHLDLSSVTAVWFRKPDYPKLAPHLKMSERSFAVAECWEALEGLYNSLRDCFWISPIHNMRRAENKPLQLQVASRAGFVIPATIITNNPDEAWKFFMRHNGEIVYKSLAGGVLRGYGGPWDETIVEKEIYTTYLQGYTRRDFETVTSSACLFQEHIEKKFELRITVVEKQVFAAEIHSQTQASTVYDWRRGSVEDVPHCIHDLPDAVSHRCVGLVERLGLTFGAIDMIVTPDDEYVFLEINPNGQFGWLEEETGLEISKAIAEALINRQDRD